MKWYKKHEPSITRGTNCWTPLVIKSGTAECYFTASTANSAESWISKRSDFFKSRKHHTYINICLHTRHCDVILLSKLHYFLWRKKTPRDVKFIDILLIRVQAMLWATFFIHIYSVDMEKHVGQEQWSVNTTRYAGFEQLIYLFAKSITVSWMSLAAITFICPSLHQPRYRKDLYPHCSESNKIILHWDKTTISFPN